jgi:tRNA dimethylallyltransferase
VTPPLIVVGGATATGKTGLAIRLAESLIADGRVAEVISADSRQIYRGLDIATAKATVEDRRRVIHHGLDLADPDTTFTVADFDAHLAGVLSSLDVRHGIAILAGGTGFYLRSVMRGLDTARLPADPAIRAGVRADLAVDGLDRTYERLVSLAPNLAASIERSNPRRVERALEIALIQGDAPLPAPGGYPGPMVAIGLTAAPNEHKAWIEHRARAQFDAGLLEEARILRERWDPSLPAFSAIGYREAWSVLDGESTVADAIDADIARNVAFAKRQRTWFKAEPTFTWIDVTHDDPFEMARSVAGTILPPL